MVDFTLAQTGAEVQETLNKDAPSNPLQQKDYIDNGDATAEANAKAFTYSKAEIDGKDVAATDSAVATANAYTDQQVIEAGSYTQAIATKGEIQAINLKVYPAEFSQTASTSAPYNSAPAGTDALRDAVNGKIYTTSEVVSGAITAIDFVAGTATVGGVSITLKERVDLTSENGTITYKASGGNSAVENMIADFDANPLANAIGTITKTGGTTWEYINSTGPITIDNFRAFNCINVKDLGAKGDGVDDTTALEYAFSILGEYQTLFFPAGEYPTRRMLRTDKSHIQIQGDDKYTARITAFSGGFDSGSGTSLVWLGDGTTTARIRVTRITITAAGGVLANDTDGLTIHPFFNADIEDCRFQGGNYVTRETGGMRIVDGRHTRVHNNQFHNGFCHGLTIDEHLNGLNITGNAFDETSCGIKSFGNILEMNITGSNEFGSAIRNPSFPAPTDRRVIDLSIGVHGSIGIVGNILTGGSETEFGIRYSYVENLRIVGNQIGQNKRFAICGDSTGRNLTITGNTFNGNGADATDLNPANGLRDPDATPFCSDIYLHTLFTYPTNIVGNASDLSDRVMVWGEGTTSALSTSAFSCSGNNSRFGDIAFVHQTTVKSTDVIQDASFMLKGVAPTTGTITSRTVTRGAPEFSTVSVPGVVDGDLVTASVKNFGGLDYNLVLSVEVQGNNLVRWVLVNTSDTPIAILDTDIVISAIKI